MRGAARDRQRPAVDTVAGPRTAQRVGTEHLARQLGKICEVAAPDALYKHPSHPYTAGLLAAIPVPDPSVKPEERPALAGEIPSPVAPPSGCRFRTRCPKAQDKCAAEEPQIREMTPGQFVACHFPLAPGETLATRNGQMPSTA